MNHLEQAYAETALDLQRKTEAYMALKGLTVDRIEGPEISILRPDKASSIVSLVLTNRIFEEKP